MLRHNSWRLMRRLYKETLGPHILSLILSFVCMWGVASTSSYQTYLMKPLIDKVFLARDSHMLWVIAWSILGLFVIRSVARYGQEILLVSLGQKIVASVQSRLFGRVINSKMTAIESQSAGSLAAYFTYDANQLRLAVCDVFLSVGKDTMTVIGMVFLMFHEDWSLAIVAVIAAPLAIIPMQKLGRRLRRLSLETQDKVGDLTHSLDQAFRGIVTLKTYGLEAQEENRVDGQIESWAALVVRSVWTSGAIVPIVDGVGGLAIAAVIIYGGHQVIAHQITPGALFVFVGAIAGAYAPVPSLSKTNNKLQTGLAAAQRIFELYDRSVEIAPANDTVALPRASGAIEFHDVSFTYPDMDRPALDGLSLIAPAGLVTALVGRAGAGKSTVLNLIEHFYDPSEGSVWVNGQDLRSTNLQTLRESIALVSQNVTLFDDTIATNIGYGRLGATGDEILAAGEAAGVLDFAMRLPQGINTHLGAGGVILSGGQRQCISIARAILRDAPILLLDEATAAQDAVSEHHIQKALHRLMQGRTTIVIAHRLGTIKHADMIHVLDAGKVVESGRHDDLVNKDGLYATLHKLQFQDEEVGLRTTSYSSISDEYAPA